MADYTSIHSGSTIDAAVTKVSNIEKTASEINDSLDLADSAYQKPSTGVPKTDLAQGVKDSLDLADSAVQDVSGKEDKANKKTTITDSDTDYPTTKAVKTALAGKSNIGHTHTLADIDDAGNVAGLSYTVVSTW